MKFRVERGQQRVIRTYVQQADRVAERARARRPSYGDDREIVLEGALVEVLVPPVAGKRIQREFVGVGLVVQPDFEARILVEPRHGVAQPLGEVVVAPEHQAAMVVSQQVKRLRTRPHGCGARRWRRFGRA